MPTFCLPSLQERVYLHSAGKAHKYKRRFSWWRWSVSGICLIKLRFRRTKVSGVVVAAQWMHCLGSGQNKRISLPKWFGVSVLSNTKIANKLFELLSNYFLSQLLPEDV